MPSAGEFAQIIPARERNTLSVRSNHASNGSIAVGYGYEPSRAVESTNQSDARSRFSGRESDSVDWIDPEWRVVCNGYESIDA